MPGTCINSDFVALFKSMRTSATDRVSVGRTPYRSLYHRQPISPASIASNTIEAICVEREVGFAACGVALGGVGGIGTSDRFVMMRTGVYHIGNSITT